MPLLGAAALSLADLPLFSGCSAVDDSMSSTQDIVDSIGRNVTLPSPRYMQDIYFTSPLAQIFCFTLAPDLLAGTSLYFDKDQLSCLPEGTSDLPYLGTLSMGGTIDTEALDYMGVQAVFSISGTDLTDVNISDALNLEAQTGIPAVLIDGSFDLIGDTYRLLGSCLGREERAEQLAIYCEDVYSRVTSAVAAVPNEERVTYYFAEGSEGLKTETNLSQHSLAFTTAGGLNVAADAASVVDANGFTDVSLEQIQQWNPQYIITWDFETREGASRLIKASSAWKGISAVDDGRVYEMPAVPFAFCDRPPGVNRFLGIQWLANLFYPQYYDVDMVEVVREFYSHCYWRDISVDQARSILGDSYKAGNMSGVTA